MILSPQKFREVLLGLLFSRDFYTNDSDDIADLVVHELKITPRQAALAQEKVQKISQHLEEIDAAITKVSTSYDFERIGRVERNILRLAVYELVFEKKQDVAVIIAEAKRLAKKFSTPESALFCKAIVDTIGKSQAGNKDV
jgi:N utilization substance protein B